MFLLLVYSCIICRIASGENVCVIGSPECFILSLLFQVGISVFASAFCLDFSPGTSLQEEFLTPGSNYNILLHIHPIPRNWLQRMVSLHQFALFSEWWDQGNWLFMTEFNLGFTVIQYAVYLTQIRLYWKSVALVFQSCPNMKWHNFDVGYKSYHLKHAHTLSNLKLPKYKMPFWCWLQAINLTI